MNAKQKLHQAQLTRWAALIKEQTESGLSIREWCRQNNKSFHAYNYWKHLLKESVVDSVLPDIVPISQPLIPTPQTSNQPLLIPSSAPSYNSPDLYKAPPTTLSPISISLGDVRIEIGPNASDDVISSIIKAVRHA